jgi:hypothetical protein
VPAFLRLATIMVALVVAAWTAIGAARNQPPQRSHLIGIGVLQLFAVALTATAVADWAGGGHPRETGTFVGYVITFVLLPAVGYQLARLEPTRWGTTVLAAAAAVEAVLVLRLQQTWVGLG